MPKLDRPESTISEMECTSNPEQVKAARKSPGISRRSKKIRICYIYIAVATALLDLLAWRSSDFCDAYIAHVFPLWVNTYGRVMGIFPFSVGEWLLIVGILLVCVAVALAFGCGIFRLCELAGKTENRRLLRREENPTLEQLRKLDLEFTGNKRLLRRGANPEESPLTGSRFRWIRTFYVFCAWVLLAVCLIMTLNCSLLYHVSTFSQKYLGGDPGEYSVEELLRVRNFVAAQCDRLSREVARGEKGYILYPGSVSEKGGEIDMQDKAREEMARLGETYPQLKGYYPRPKPMFFSDFMCQQSMLGWYFPFSMEANYNKVAYVMNQPASMCHELAHLKGFIYEDEANFIGYLACVQQSEDVYFEYSGYLSVLGYLENDLRKAARQRPDEYAAAVEAQGFVKLSEIVYQDDMFVTEEDWKRINGKAILDTETVDKATDTFLDTTLKANGVPDGKISYNRVVELLLQYYAVYPDKLR